MDAGARRTVDLEQVIDGAKLGPVHYGLLVLCAVALCIDGFDIFMVGNLAPAIAAGLHTSPSSMGIVFAVQQGGLAVGAFAISPICDRFGRRRILLACFVAFGLVTLATAQATAIASFAILRGVAGVFLSGVIPSALALLVEATPGRHRSLFVSLAFAGYAAGSAGGAAVAALLLTRYGWQIGFWIGGIVPLVFTVLCFRLVPESIAFLHRRDPADPRLKALLGRFVPAFRGRDRVIAPAPHRPVTRLAALFGPGRLWITLSLWGIYFIGLGTITLSLGWMATFYNVRAGIPIPTYSSVAAVSLLGGMVGTVAVGVLQDRLPPVPVLIGFAVLGVVALQALSHAVFGTLLFAAALAALAFAQSAGQTGINAVATRIYPVEVRATGVGWAFGVGRIGAVVGPALGGLMLASGWSIAAFLSALAVALGVSGLLLVVLHRAWRQQAQPSP